MDNDFLMSLTEQVQFAVGDVFDSMPDAGKPDWDCYKVEAMNAISAIIESYIEPEGDEA